MSNDKTKQRFYPLKPRTSEGFKKAVAWLGGRELVSSLKGIIIYAIYGENMDPRSWMKPNLYPDVEEVEEKVKPDFKDQAEAKAKAEITKADGEYEKYHSVIQNQTDEKIEENSKFQNKIKETIKSVWTKKVFDNWEWKRQHFRFWESYLSDKKFWTKLKEGEPLEEFWFDYIADSGDGQMGVYGVGCLCLSDLWLTGKDVGSKVKIQLLEKEEADKFKKAEGKLVKELNAIQSSFPEEQETTENEIQRLKDELLNLRKKYFNSKVERANGYELLPRGAFLFVGGDTAYHSATYETLFERFQTPFRWAFMSVRKLASKHYVLKRTANEKIFFVGDKPKNVYQKGTIEPINEWDGTIGDMVNGKKYWDTEPLRPLFGIPANHDYYDGIDGFNKQFRRTPFEEIEENMLYEDDDRKGRMILQIPTFSREQEASYIAVRLPFDWWFFGIDSENEKLDYRQEVFFKQIMKRKPSKLILATPEPTTVFGKISAEKEKTANYLRTITQSLNLEQPFLSDGKIKKLTGEKREKSEQQRAEEIKYSLDTKENPTQSTDGEKYCRLDLSGDVHHYARYWGENTREFSGGRFSSGNYASLVSGGGGAFFDPTETVIGTPKVEKGELLFKDGSAEKVRGEIPPQRIFPLEEDSINATSKKIFDLWNIRKGGYVQIAGAIFAILIYALLLYYSNIGKLFEEKFDWTPVTAALFLTIVVILVAVGAYRLNSLIETLKQKIFDDEINSDWDGGIPQLLWISLPFWVAIVSYLLFLRFSPTLQDVFSKSYFLLVHFIICGLLAWLSADYSNWLPVRFKIMRGMNEKTFIQEVEDPNVVPTNIIKRFIGRWSREFSWRYIPAHILNILAVGVLITGIRLFGHGDLPRILSDILLIIVILGGLGVISYVLAVRTGAAYHGTKYKFYFALIGLWHAILQLAAPVVVYYYASPKVILILLVIVLVVNGLPLRSKDINVVSKNGADEKLSFWEKINSFQAASYLMRKNNRTALTFGWISYGLLILGAPLASWYFWKLQTIKEFVESQSPAILEILNSAGIIKLLGWLSISVTKDRVFFWVSIAIVAYLGFYLSRVWFSWYLAVSLAFNGHNNEAGGAARIEGFKHILRIKVTENELTVYVIGFKRAQSDIENLSPELVDVFSLKPEKLK